MAKQQHTKSHPRHTFDVFVNLNAADQDAPKKWDRVVNVNSTVHDSAKLAAAAAATEMTRVCTGAVKRPSDFKIEIREADPAE